MSSKWRHLLFALLGVGLFALAAGVLHVLLPGLSRPGFGAFVGIFLVAQLGGLVSQVPGGLGVFETLIVVTASDRVPADRLLGALVVYRGLYYLLPLMLATGALGAQELLRRRAWLKKATGIAAEIFPALMIPVLSLAVFVSGAAPFPRQRLLTSAKGVLSEPRAGSPRPH